MSVTPTGAPAWVRSNDHTVYGGDLNKKNYQGQGAVNPQTDVTAENIARIAADLEALAAVAPFATLTFTCNDTAPAAPTVDDYNAMAGTAPTGARVGNGSVTFDWAASYTDAYSVSGDIHLVGAQVTVHGSGTGFATVTISDQDSNGKNERIAVVVKDHANATVSDATVTVTVWTGVA